MSLSYNHPLNRWKTKKIAFKGFQNSSKRMFFWPPQHFKVKAFLQHQFLVEKYFEVFFFPNDQYEDVQHDSIMEGY